MFRRIYNTHSPASRTTSKDVQRRNAGPDPVEDVGQSKRPPRVMVLGSILEESGGRGFNVELFVHTQHSHRAHPRARTRTRTRPEEMVLHKSPSAVEVNRNTDWMSSPGTWTAYASAVFFFWLVCCSWMDAGSAWSTTLVVHSLVTFYLLHWKKGAPFQFDQDDYKKLTFWEQMDAGVQLTKNKKFFMAMPVVLFLLASHVTGYRQPMMSINFVLTVILLIGKLPNMYKVRIFGINED